MSMWNAVDFVATCGGGIRDPADADAARRRVLRAISPADCVAPAGYPYYALALPSVAPVATATSMKMAPLQPHASWYRRFWYNERSPLDTLVDRVLILAIIAVTLLAGSTTLARHGTASHITTTNTDTAATR
jgi:hypothetical protein